MNLPINAEAEDSLIGSFMCSFRNVGSLLAERGITHEMFLGPGNQAIVQEMIEAWQEGVNLDPMLLISRLQAKGTYQDAGGHQVIVKLTSMPTGINASYYADMVVETHQLRQVALICAQKGREATLDGAEAHSIVSELSEAITAIAGVRNKAPAMSMRQLAMAKLERIQ